MEKQRLIDADALIKWLSVPTGFRATCEDCTDIDCIDCIIEEAIKNSPTIDPVKHGYWMETTVWDGMLGKCYRKCSVCGTIFYGVPSKGQEIKYCQECGARMDLEEPENGKSKTD